LQESYGEDLPTVWAFHSPARQSGTSLVVSLLGGLAQLHGYDVEMLTPSWWDVNSADHTRQDHVLDPDDLQRLYCGLPKSFFAAGEDLFSAIQSLHPAQSSARLWLLDLGCSFSHVSLDLYWSADVQLVVADARSVTAQRLSEYEFSVRQRLIEKKLCWHDEALHASLARAPEQARPDACYPFWDSHKLRHLNESTPLFYILNRCGATTVEEERRSDLRRSHAAHAYVGTLPEETQSAFLLGSLKRYHRAVSNTHLRISNRSLTHKLDSPESRLNIANNAVTGTGAWVQINESRVLNLDLAHFDTSPQNTLFAALDEDELF